MNIISYRSKVKNNCTTNLLIQPLLYHASPYKNLKVLIPKKKTVRDPNEGPVVFATPDNAYASMFLFPHDDSWVKCGVFNGVHFIVISDKNRFIKLDKGGAIYNLSDTGFTCDLKKGGREKEWISKVPVIPLACENYDSDLDTMISFGVQVYFTNQRVFKMIGRSHDHGYEIIRNLISENRKLGILQRNI